MKQSVSPAVIAIALVVVLVVVFFAYKLTMGKGKAEVAANVPGVGQYGGAMPGATPGAGMGGQVPQGAANMGGPGSTR